MLLHGKATTGKDGFRGASVQHPTLPRRQRNSTSQAGALQAAEQRRNQPPLEGSMAPRSCVDLSRKFWPDTSVD